MEFARGKRKLPDKTRERRPWPISALRYSEPVSAYIIRARVALHRFASPPSLNKIVLRPGYYISAILHGLNSTLVT